MKKILILGLNPSSRNKNPNVPFEGTRSGNVLNEWLDYILPTDKEYIIMKRNLVNDVISSNSKDVRTTDIKRNLPKIKRYIKRRNPDLIIAVGGTVRKIIPSIAPKQTLVLFLMHPSPRNRKLNSQEIVNRHLEFNKGIIQNYWSICNAD